MAITLQERKNEKTKERKNAKTQERKNEKTKKRKNARTKKRKEPPSMPAFPPSSWKTASRHSPSPMANSLRLVPKANC